MGSTRRRPPICPLAKAAFQAFQPFINLHDPGRKLPVLDEHGMPVRDPATGQWLLTPKHTISKNLRRRYEEYRKDQYVTDFLPGHYHARVFNARMVEQQIAGQEVHYYTSGQCGCAILYLDVDAHRPEQLPDLPASVELLSRLFPQAFQRESLRGHNGYLKVRYATGWAGPSSWWRFNKLADRLEKALKLIWRAEGRATDIEIKGTITTATKAGRLAKLPFANWTQQDLDSWNAAPTLTLAGFRGLVEQLERMAQAAEQHEQVTPSPVPATRLVARERDRHDQESNRFTANVQQLMGLARRLRRVPEVEEALDYLRENNLYTGSWDDGEARRERRVAFIIDRYVEPDFDARKCGGNLQVEPLTALVNQYTEWATSKYGSGVRTLVGGKLVEITSEALGIHLAICLYILEQNPNHQDGGIPYSRIKGLWTALAARGLVAVPFSYLLYRRCRTFLDHQDILNITDREYSVGCSMRYGRGQWFPGCYKGRQVLEAVPTQLPTRPRFSLNKRNTTSLKPVFDAVRFRSRRSRTGPTEMTVPGPPGHRHDRQPAARKGHTRVVRRRGAYWASANEGVSRPATGG